MKQRYFNNKFLNFIFTSDAVEAFVFCVLCATVFTAGMCHWILDVGYKYIAADRSMGRVDFNWVFWVGAIATIYYLIRKRSIKFDFALVILCQTFVLIGVMDYHEERYDVISYAWILPMAYILGKVAVGDDPKTVNYRVEKLYWAMAIGIFITGLLDILTDFKYASVLGFRDGQWPSFWLGGIFENRCTYELGFVLITTAAGYLIYSSKRNIFCLVFLIQANLIIQRLDIRVTGRENRLLLPIGLVIFIVLYVYDNWRYFHAKTKCGVRIGGFAALFVLLCAIVAFRHNWFGLYDRYLNSNWSSGGGVLTNIRFAYDLSGFKSMLEYPLEDYDIYGLQRPHSMLLEYGRVFDIAVWGLLVLFRLYTIKEAFVLALRKNEYSWIKYLLIPAFVALNLYYSMEPNGYDHRHLWMIGLFLSGMIKGLNNNNVAKNIITL